MKLIAGIWYRWGTRLAYLQVKLKKQLLSRGSVEWSGTRLLHHSLGGLLQQELPF